MKNALFLLISTGFTFFACQNDRIGNLNEGQIIGQDARNCACCGGWFLETADTTFLFTSFPEGANVDLQNETFPLPVKFEYAPDTSFCNGFMNRITLTHIEVQ